MIDEAKESIKENLKQKIVSPFYGSFIVSWCLWNWKLVYVTFLVNGSDLVNISNITKNQYAERYFSDMTSFVFLLYLFILPLVSTMALILIISRYVSPWFYARSLESDTKNKKEWFKKEADVQKERKKLLGGKSEEESQKIEILNKEKEAVESQKEIEKLKIELFEQKEKQAKVLEVIESADSLTEQEKWEEEYKSFYESGYGKYFKDLNELIYEYSGYTDNYKRNNDGGLFTSDALAYFDVSKLIEINEQTMNENESVSLTNKGKFFMKKFLEEGDKAELPKINLDDI